MVVTVTLRENELRETDSFTQSDWKRKLARNSMCEQSTD